MEVTLRQLRAFTALARTGSFTRAAETLHITQSALSGLMKELESQLGVKLVNRTTRRIQLSEVGVEFHSVATRILRELDSAVDNIDSLKRLRRGIVRMAAPQLMASTLIPEVIASFKEAHPDIQIHLQDCAVDNAIAQVVRGDVDFGIGPHRQGMLNLETMPLLDLPFMAIFPNDHPLKSLKKVSWEELVAYPMITLQGQFTDRLAMDLYKTSSIPNIVPSQEVAFMSTALSMVSANLGVTAGLPYSERLVKIHGLCMRPLVQPVVNRQFLIYKRQHYTLPPAAEVFVEYLFDYVKQKNWG